jgi:hypothetical protein
MQRSFRLLRGYFFLIILSSVLENHAMLSDEEGERSPFLRPVGEIHYPPAPPSSPTMFDGQKIYRSSSPAFCSLAANSPLSLEEEADGIIQQWQGVAHGPEKIAPLNREVIIDGLVNLMEKRRFPTLTSFREAATTIYQELLAEEETLADMWAGLTATVVEILAHREEEQTTISDVFINS